jgi:hypothetical protein
MVPILEVVLGLLAVTPVAGAAYAAAFAYRAGRRNAVERCGHCGGPQYASGALTGPSLVQGRLVCAACAARSARRMQLALGGTVALGGAVVIGTTLGAALSGGGAFWWFPTAAVVQYSLLTGGAVTWMKRRNRLAGRALTPGAAHDGARTLR